MNWDDPAVRAALIKQIGPDAYNEAFAEHVRQSTIATVAGHAIRLVGSRFGQLYMVGNTRIAFNTLEEAEAYALEHPVVP